MADDKDNVLQFTGLTTVDVPPSEVLELAKRWGMETCIVLGETEEGELCIGGNTCNLAEIITLLVRAQHWCVTEIGL